MIHKLITIGTPHLGSPLAMQVLQPSNNCTRRFLADHDKLSFRHVSVAGVTVNGAMGDLQGDGHGGQTSVAIQSVQQGNGREVPTATVAGIIDGNLSGLNCTACGAEILRKTCRPSGDPLAVNLTESGWPTIFGQDSDGIVPLFSQINGTPSAATVRGVVHSAGLVGRLGLSFNGPNELDPLSGFNTTQTSVIQLLNTPELNQPFAKLP